MRSVWEGRLRDSGAAGLCESAPTGEPAGMQKRLPDTTVTVLVPSHNELRAGTLQSIIRQSGIARGEFGF